MILNLIGLIWSFIGSISLIFDALLNPSSISATIFNPMYGKGNKIKGYMRLQPKPKLEGGYNEVKISKEEIKMIISLSLLSLGFLLQILDIFT